MTPKERRNAILGAATRVFAERGFHATNIATIAGELGMGHGTFYRYFANKLDLFGHVVDTVVERLAGALLTEPPGTAMDLAAYQAQVERIAQRLFALFREDPALARLLFVASVGVDADITARRQAALDAVTRLTGAYLEHGVRVGYLRADLDVPATARAMNALILGAVPQVLAAPDPEAERDRWIAAASSLIFTGIAA